MKPKKLMLGLSCLMMTAGLMPAANAAPPITGKLQIKANFGNSCTLNSGDNSVLDFGTQDDLTVKPIDEKTVPSSGIDVQCSKNLQYSISLIANKNVPKGTLTIYGYMTNGVDLINYGLYKDEARKDSWAYNSYRVTGVGTGENRKYTVYGRIFRYAKTPPPGQYSDDVIVQLSF